MRFRLAVIVADVRHVQTMRRDKWPFSDFLGSMVNHIVPIKKRSLCSDNFPNVSCVSCICPHYYHHVSTSFGYLFGSVFLCFSVLYPPYPLLASPALLYPLQHTHMYTRNRQHTTDTIHTTDSTQHTIHLFGAHFGGYGVCFWPSHRGRRRFGWDVSPSCCVKTVEPMWSGTVTYTLTHMCTCDRYLASGLSK